MSFEAREVEAHHQPAESLELADPRAMRALAHPTRLALLEHLHLEGPATATQCGEAIGESPASCSYHLRALARWGLVEEAPGGKGRQRPWRMAARSISFSSAPGSADQLAAASLLRREVLARDERVLREFFEHEAELPEEWREAASLGNGVLYLTLQELDEVVTRVRTVLQDFDRRERPAGARRVDLLFRALPRRG